MENNAPIIDENQAVELFEKRLENLKRDFVMIKGI
jgi:hypothetical protein